MKKIILALLTLTLTLAASNSFAQVKPTDPPTKPDWSKFDPAKLDELKQAITDFQSARDTFLKTQKELIASLKDASAEERAKIRADIKANVDEWRSKAKEFAADIREAAKSIKDKIPSASEVIDSAKKEGRGR